MTNQATRIIVKAAGDLAPEAVASGLSDDADVDDDNLDAAEETKEALAGTIEEAAIDIETYIPDIRADRTWSISELDLSASPFLYSWIRLVMLRAEWIADGCGILGTGGGGTTYPPYLMARQLLREGKEIIVGLLVRAVRAFLDKHLYRLRTRTMWPKTRSSYGVCSW